MSYTASVITVSDKGYTGKRKDESGPILCDILKQNGFDVVHSSIVPDEKEMIEKELIKCCDELKVSLVLTTGGTGFSPRDITPEATRKLIEREAQGIAEMMRAESIRITPKGCLSRGIAGIRNRSLIINLPGSPKAARENIEAVIKPVIHGLEMLMGVGSADCATLQKNIPPSMESWLKEAKQCENAHKIGMYLTHNGVVRATPKAMVRDGDKTVPEVTGMVFSYDENKVNTVIEDTLKLNGIYYVRVWLNEGKLSVGDDIMYALIGGDIRPNVTNALDYLVGRIKTECVTETETYLLFREKVGKKLLSRGRT